MREVELMQIMLAWLCEISYIILIMPLNLMQNYQHEVKNGFYYLQGREYISQIPFCIFLTMKKPTCK